MTTTKIQKAIANRFMRMTVHNYVKKLEAPTVEKVLQAIDPRALATLYQYEYTENEIKAMIEEVIRRQK